MKNITEDAEWIAEMPFREDNNVEVAYAIKNGCSFKLVTIFGSLHGIIHVALVWRSTW